MQVVKLTTHVYQVMFNAGTFSVKVILNSDPNSNKLFVLKTQLFSYQTSFNLNGYGHVNIVVEGASEQPVFFNDIPVDHLPYTHTHYDNHVVNKIVAALNKICCIIDEQFLSD